MSPPSTVAMIAASAFAAAAWESAVELPAMATAISVSGVMFLTVVVPGSARKARNSNPGSGVTRVPVASSAIVVFAPAVTTSNTGPAQAVVQLRLYWPAAFVRTVASWPAGAWLLPQYAVTMPLAIMPLAATPATDPPAVTAGAAALPPPPPPPQPARRIMAPVSALKTKLSPCCFMKSPLGDAANERLILIYGRLPRPTPWSRRFRPGSGNRPWPRLGQRYR